MNESKCRFCRHPLQYCFANLGMSPISNAYLTSKKLQAKENFYPLQTFVCEQCFLVQLEEYESPEAIFTDYAYFSSYSDTWLQHARTYVEMITQRLDLNKLSFVIEIASNDGNPHPFLTDIKSRGLSYRVEKRIFLTGLKFKNKTLLPHCGIS